MNKEEILTISSSWFRTEHLVQPCQSGSLTWMQLVVEGWLTQTPQGGSKTLGKRGEFFKKCSPICTSTDHDGCIHLFPRWSNHHCQYMIPSKGHALCSEAHPPPPSPPRCRVSQDSQSSFPKRSDKQLGCPAATLSSQKGFACGLHSNLKQFSVLKGLLHASNGLSCYRGTGILRASGSVWCPTC